MDTVAVLFEGGRLAFGFLLLVFLSGFNLSLIVFPRSTSLRMIDRLVYSTLLSISSVIAFVLFMNIVLEVNTTTRTISLISCVLAELALIFWGVRRWYRDSPSKDRGGPQLPADSQRDQRYDTREINAAKDRFRKDTRTRVVYHEHQQSSLTHIDHSYLLDAGEEIAVQQVEEHKLKVTDRVILQPPYPRTRYFELVIREYNEDGLSLVDDLQIYPVYVTRRPDRTISGAGTPHISGRIHKKTSTTEVQWIYSHDFHIFAIIHAEDTLDQLVDRILGKLDEIALSLKSGVPASSPAEERQILKDAFDAVIEKPREIPVGAVEIPKRPLIEPGVEPKLVPRQVIEPGIELQELPKRAVQQGVVAKEIQKRMDYKLRVEPIRKLQREILRDMDMFHLTPDSFGRSRKPMENIKISEKSDVRKRLADVKEEVRDLDWLYE